MHPALLPTLVGLFGVVVFYVRFLYANFQQGYGLLMPLPFEDAAMLFRYAENLASGYGIVWNEGDAPGDSDGATDFGFVLLLAPLITLGVNPPTAGLMINVTGLFAIGYLLTRMNREEWFLPTSVPLLLVALIALGVWSPIAGGFSSAAFGAILLSVLLTSQWAMRNYRPEVLLHRDFVIVGIVAAAAGWWRPEGFLLTPFIFLLSAITPRNLWIFSTWRRFLALVLSGAAGFIVVFAGWITFRMTYFGYLTPTAGTNKLESAYWAVVNSFRTIEIVGFYYLIALLPILTAVLLVAILTARLITILLPLAVVAMAALLWTPFDLTFNWWGRIWWPLIPVLVAWIVTFVVQVNATNGPPVSNRRIRLSGLAITGCGLLLLLVFPRPSTGEWPPEYERLPFHTTMYDALRPLDTTSLRVATTEAGLVPLAVDEGAALDTWVHNTRSIAEKGVAALPAELTAFHPNMIVVHGPTPIEFLGGETCTQFDPDWTTQARILYAYALEANLSLVRVDKTGPCDTWSIFVSPTVSNEIVTAIDQARQWADRVY